MNKVKQFFNSDKSIHSIIFSVVILGLWLSIAVALFNEAVYTDWLPYVYAAAGIILTTSLIAKWRDMNSPVGITWRRILLAGNIIVLGTAVAIFTKNFHEIAFMASIFYWLALPGYGFRIIADFTEGNSSFYILQSHLSSFMVLFFLLGFLTDSPGLQAVVAIAGAVSHGSAAYSTLNN